MIPVERLEPTLKCKSYNNVLSHKVKKIDGNIELGHLKVIFKEDIPEHTYNIGYKIDGQTEKYSQMSALVIGIFFNKMNHRAATATQAA